LGEGKKFGPESEINEEEYTITTGKRVKGKKIPI